MSLSKCSSAVTLINFPVVCSIERIEDTNGLKFGSGSEGIGVVTTNYLKEATRDKAQLDLLKGTIRVVLILDY